MADDKSYQPVVEALLKQTRAINQLARELKEEFTQYQTAVKSNDTKRANAIADAINQRTARLVEATEKLDQSTPDAGVGGGPADPTGRPDQGLPGRDRPTDPGFGQGNVPNRPDQGLPGEQPGAGQDLPGAPSRPDQGLPGAGSPDQSLPGGRPERPDQGLPGQRPNRPDQGLPGSGGRPDQGLPGQGGRPDQGLPPSAGRPDQGLPPGAQRPDQGLPPEGGTKPIDPNAPEAGQELPEGSTPPPTAGQPLPPSAGTKPVEPTDPNAQPK